MSLRPYLPAGLLAGLLSLAFAAPVMAQSVGTGDLQPDPDAIDPFGGTRSPDNGIPALMEYKDKISAAELVSPLGSDLFGENVSLYDGQSEFSNVDIDIPGNSGLSVQLRRRFVIEPLKKFAEPKPLGGFGNWDIDVPYISGVFDANEQWNKVHGVPTPRCSQMFLPYPASVSSDGPTQVSFSTNDLFSGISVHIPGQGDNKLMWATPDSVIPSDSQQYYWVTRDYAAFSCVPSLDNGYAGQGFKMHTTDGLVWTFNWGINRTMPPIVRGNARLNRMRVYLLATHVEDRYGNYVDYQYTQDGYLTGVTASDYNHTDTRSIALSYYPRVEKNQLVQVQSATATASDAPARTWTYEYDTCALPNDTKKRLCSVTLPDNQSKWHFVYSNGRYIDPVHDDGSSGWCTWPPFAFENFSLTIDHPSGAHGVFKFDMTRHYRSVHALTVGSSCPAVPRVLDVFSLSKKTISGAGVPSYLWQYSYPASPGNTPTDKVVNITLPSRFGVEEKMTYRFGRYYNTLSLAQTNDGKLLETQNIQTPAGGSAQVVHSVNNTYVSDVGLMPNCSSGPYCVYGQGLGGFDPASVIIYLLQSVVTTQDGTGQLSTFTRTNSGFDRYARPRTATRGSFAWTVDETTAYHDNTDRWILGQIESVKTTKFNGQTMNKTSIAMGFTPDDEVKTVTQFGKLKMTYGYYGNGTLASAKDGNNRVTTFNNYKRGIPKNISYATGHGKQAGVDDFGQIYSVKDEMLFETTYGHDKLGRLTSITPPAGDTPAWNPTTRQFVWGTESTSGISGTHWYRIDRTGNTRKIVYYDALMRPLLTSDYDGANATNTYSYVRRSFDYGNHETYTSYPSRTTSTGTGTYTVHDVIGRPLTINANSELGNLQTQITWLPLLGKKVRDPRGNETTTHYQGFDTPAYDVATYINAPEGQNTWIDPDAFGKPKSMQRTDASGSQPSLTRTYTYDAYERLCKTLDPESGATIQDYDGAGNVAWSVTGTNWNGTGCGAFSVPVGSRTTYSYDNRNRLLSTNYPSGTSAVSNSYYPDGALKTTTSNGATWTYDYNHRRLLESESPTTTGNCSRSAGLTIRTATSKV